MTNQIKVAVVGASGKSGKYLTEELLRRKFNVRALVRVPEKQGLTGDLLEVVTGNVLDYGSVLNLLQGCQAVISTLGQRKGEPPVFAAATGNILKAMGELEIRRYILLTGMSLDVPGDRKKFINRFLSWMMRTAFTEVLKDKQEEYALLPDSRADWTVVRVPMIVPEDITGTCRTSLVDCQGKRIGTRDLAGFLCDQLLDESFIRKAPFLSN
ncbi:MAG: NAD(P)-dependent oxidoreductase [Bacteroidota bacterium]